MYHDQEQTNTFVNRFLTKYTFVQCDLELESQARCHKQEGNSVDLIKVYTHMGNKSIPITMILIENNKLKGLPNCCLVAKLKDYIQFDVFHCTFFSTK